MELRLDEPQSEPHDLLRAIDEVLNRRGPLIACGIWNVQHHVAELAFDLSLSRAGGIRNLPVNPRVAYLPVSAEDFACLQEPSLLVHDVVEARKCARVRRATTAASRFTGDLKNADWEYGVGRRMSRFQNLKLPRTAFVALDRVDASGCVIKGHRPVIGRYARGSTGIRAAVLSAPHKGLTRKSSQAFKEADLIIANAQLIRSRRTGEDIRHLAQFASATGIPTLIVTTTPGDVVFLGPDDLSIQSSWLPLGNPPEAVFSINAVCADRLAAERSFEFAIADLPADQCGSLIALGKAAWWARRSSLNGNVHPLVGKFNRIFEDLMSSNPQAARQLTALRQLINEDTRVPASERKESLLQLVQASFGKRMLVLVRDFAGLHELKQALRDRFGIDNPEQDLITIRTLTVGAKDIPSAELCICAGYFGMRTIDVVLAARPQRVEFVFDPLEARIAALHTREMRACAVGGECESAASTLSRLEAALSTHVIGFSSDLIEVGNSAFLASRESIDTNNRYAPAHDEVGLCFTDGTRLDVSRNARFELVGAGIKSLKNVAAADLKPGDQVIVLDESSRALYSELLLETLDKGPWKYHAEQRNAWLEMVHAVQSSTGNSVGTIGRRMAEMGQETDPQTIRTWLRNDRAIAAVPDKRERFIAFARALWIQLPVAELESFYESINALRRAHRILGRELARAIRAAYVGRLSPASLQRIERTWGLGARELVESARIATVDEVIAAEEGVVGCR